VRYVTAALVLLVLASTTSPLGHGATLPPASDQQDSLLFTVNPDRSVRIGWNTTTFATVLRNASMLFPAGYAIQSSTYFVEQTNAVVERTSLQYQLPPQVYTQIPYSLVNSVNLTATQNDTSGSGSLVVSTGLPIQTLSLNFTTSANRIVANATAHIYYNPALASFFPDFANQMIFREIALKTFQNRTWTDSIVAQMENATRIPFTMNRILNVVAFNSTVTYPDSASAIVKIGFVAEPYGSAADFVEAIENALSSYLPSGLDIIVRSALNLVTGESMTLTYTGQTGTLAVQYTMNFVSNLDSQLNSVKKQYFQYLLGLLATTDITPSERFLNATTVTVTQISILSNLDLHTGTSSSTLNGLIIGPPTVGTSTNFTIPGLFQTLGAEKFPVHGINITLAGGSDSSSQVKIVVPAGTLTPTSTTSNTATWTNLQNATELQNVRFVTQALPLSLLGFLTSTTGLVIEAIIAAAVIASVALYAVRRRSKMPAPLAPSGPADFPGPGPGPVPPSQSQQRYKVP
jgi:hypothetical protein